MVHANSLDRFISFTSQAIDHHSPQQSHFKVCNAKFNIEPFPQTDDGKRRLLECCRGIAMFYNQNFTTFNCPLQFPLTDHMISALTNMPHLKAYTPVLVAPDCWEPCDNLYKLAFTLNSVTRLYFKHPSEELLP